MTWSSLFLISIVQGIFLITATAYRGSKNPLASRLLIALLVLMIFPNLGYLIIRSDLRYFIPQLSALQYGSVFLFGPLFYLYSKSILDSSFRWQSEYWLHFVPYFFQFLYLLPFLLVKTVYWNRFLDSFMSGNLYIQSPEKFILIVQLLHLSIYLALTLRWFRSAKKNSGGRQYLVPLASRLKWVRQFYYCFVLLFLTVLSLFAYIIINGRYNPVTNYINTLMLSGIVYFVAYKLILNPEPISPDFTQKYRAYMQFTGTDGEKYMKKLKALMDESKVFLDPDLSLPLLAQEIGLPPHQVSKLVNEKFDKSFNDFVNEYRVREFLTRVNDPRYQVLTIYGLALEVGFNSKSSFNTAFKKITGQTPSRLKSNSTHFPVLNS
ncbi:MAG: helix-turn-helix domain-containing protein [Candidatus Zixiibacteriota bacterium]